MNVGAREQPKQKLIIPAEKCSNVLPEADRALNQLFVVFCFLKELFALDCAF